jgi:hypothetical protein
MGEQDEVFFETLHRAMAHITGYDQNTCAAAIREAINIFIRHSIIKRPKIQLPIDSFKNLDEDSIKAFHELGRLYVQNFIAKK